MVAREVEGAAGKQADGTAKTCEAKAVSCFTADSRDPKTGEPRKDRGSGAAGVRIDSAQSAGGAGRASDFGARLEQFGHRNALFEAEELVVLSDGAPWIRTVCEEILAGREMTFILDLFHALEQAAAAVQAAAPDERERKACMDRVKELLDAGQSAQVTAALEPWRNRSEAVAACIRYYEANADRMRYDPAGSADCRSVPASWKASASASSETGSRMRDAAGRKREPTPCSP